MAATLCALLAGLRSPRVAGHISGRSALAAWRSIKILLPIALANRAEFFHKLECYELSNKGLFPKFAAFLFLKRPFASLSHPSLIENNSHLRFVCSFCAFSNIRLYSQLPNLIGLFEDTPK